MRTLSALLLSALAGLLAAPAARAGVIVIDAAGGGDFTAPQAAIDAAVDGDILLVRPGNYLSGVQFVVIEGKALVLVGDEGGAITFPPLRISGVAAGKTAVVRGLPIGASIHSIAAGGSLVLQDNAGRIHVEDCSFFGFNGLASSPNGASAGVPGLRIAGCAAVAVQRCTATGGYGVSTSNTHTLQLVNSEGGSAIRIVDSRVSLHEVTATGGDGGHGQPTGAPGKPAGHGVQASGSEVIVAGCTLTGALGGNGVPPAASGAGALSEGAFAALSELDSQLTGGPGAPAVQILSGTHDTWTGSAWSLVVSSPLRTGEQGTVTASGPPNEVFGLFFSLGMGYLPKPAWRGAFLPASPFFGPLFFATTDGNGAWSAHFFGPNLLPFGLEGLLNIDQALMAQNAGLVLSSASAYIQVEPPN